MRIGSPDQQEVYLNRACAGEPELRRQVEELLKAAIAAEAVFEARATVRVADSTAWMTPFLEKVGSLIGRHKLLEKKFERPLFGDDLLSSRVFVQNAGHDEFAQHLAAFQRIAFPPHDPVSIHQEHVRHFLDLHG